MTYFERAICRCFPNAGKAWRLMHTLLTRRAQWRSMVTGRPLAFDGAPIPWITYPALDYLCRQDFSETDVLEYGGGESSLWWAARARKVITVEASVEWAKSLRERAPANLLVIGPVDLEGFAEAPFIEGFKKFDVIIIDGWRRLECAETSLESLSEGGILILDNSDWHVLECEWLRSQGLTQIDFHGFGPVNDYTWCTSVFLRTHCSVPYGGGSWPTEIYGNHEPLC